ncbi:hypothetical protein KFK09_025748 [Dendrobium nobile]|uniref:Uncharacterized protein n=1 Tax=Dendrobium nobile TaxID=94219 RepID=A0A8T3A5T4_DENNO|nr:hypothetical protein KFK09_025748 [Dendrobium nobile]
MIVTLKLVAYEKNLTQNIHEMKFVGYTHLWQQKGRKNLPQNPHKFCSCLHVFIVSCCKVRLQTTFAIFFTLIIRRYSF